MTDEADVQVPPRGRPHYIGRHHHGVGCVYVGGSRVIRRRVAIGAGIALGLIGVFLLMAVLGARA